MYARLLVSASLSLGICAPFYVPYTRSQKVRWAGKDRSDRRRKYPAMGPVFHLY
ncbi:uncharacterized protein BDV17DRAFT_203615 [Aspergillus undulatus]|uniref:uncharacterized protein n=1 Tax=Aspergillus undulatus TaxID=1810928 RepID=UPI003CCD74F4